jgi:hypothetical protein
MYLDPISIFRKARGIAFAVTMSLAVTGCGGTGSTPPTARQPDITVCPQSVHTGIRTLSTCDAGGGTTYTPMSDRLTLSDGSVSSANWDGNTAHLINSSGTNSSGQSLGTATVSYTTNAQGQNTAIYNANVPSVTSSTIQYAVPNWKYLNSGVNYLANGSVLTINDSNNTAVATFSANGISYQINFSLEADGDTVDATFIQSNGITSTAKYSASQMFPSLASSTMSKTMMAAGSRHTMSTTATKVAAVAAGVAAVATAVAVFAPVTAPVAVPVAAIATVVSAGAAIWDAFTN